MRQDDCTVPGEVVDALGGVVSLAADLKMTRSTIDSWITRGRIPAWWFPSLKRVARNRKVALDPAWGVK